MIELIQWELSALTSSVGRAAPNEWIALGLDVADIGDVLNAPESIESMEYIAEHCVCAAMYSLEGQYVNPASIYANGELFKHRGSSLFETGAYLASPKRIKFEGGRPSSAPLYVPQYSLLTGKGTSDITFGNSDYLTSAVVYEYDTPIFIKEVRYSNGGSSAAFFPNGMLLSVQLENDTWTDIPFTAFSTALITVPVNLVCKKIKISIASPGTATSWGLRRFIPISDQKLVIEEQIQSVLFCGKLAAAYINPIPWTNTRTPIIQFDVSELVMNSPNTSEGRLALPLSSQLKLEAAVL